ncbi:GGDEF domain-containing protein [Paenibacillus thermotolerans]|uniref:GGDEF domain-containing protein n=1 Tax=Paenibacillus thermotolerans TaxID=3027807 RepID=UPI002367A0F9|nr:MULTISPECIES: GGDEF domain-containing protein [unclassified Paenibacillus]
MEPQQLLGILKAMTGGTGVLIALAYMASLAHTNRFASAPSGMKQRLFAAISVCAGWLGMWLTGSGPLSTDLRFAPLALVPLLFSNPHLGIRIGFGIGLGALVYGWNAETAAAVIRMTLLGAAASALTLWLRRKRWSYGKKASIAGGVLLSVFAAVPVVIQEVTVYDLLVSLPLCAAGSMALSLAIYIMKGEYVRRIALLEEANTDHLTKLYNVRYFRQYFEALLQNPQVAKASVVFVDIDRFKSINDTYGHAFGDEVLKAVAAVLKQELRSKDFVARYGGEEFVLVLPGTGQHEAAGAADRLRRKIEASNIAAEGRTVAVTVSAGVASFPEVSKEALLPCADQALYAAKRNGRNRVEVWMEETEEKKV